MSLKLAVSIIAILLAAIIWTFVEPYVRHWKGRQAAARRRGAERRRK